jgi:hypothetical protein
MATRSSCSLLSPQTERLTARRVPGFSISGGISALKPNQEAGRYQESDCLLGQPQGNRDTGRLLIAMAAGCAGFIVLCGVGPFPGDGAQE